MKDESLSKSSIVSNDMPESHMDLETIYNDYHDKLFYYIKTKVTSIEDAEDICSEVFIKVQKKLVDYDSEKAGVSTWIYTIARNSVIDYYRTHKDADELTDEMSATLSSGEETDAALLNRETLEELAAALQKLSDEERTVIVLHYYEELSLADIEKQTGLSYGQVKLRHNSALKKMERFLSGRGGIDAFRLVKG